MSTPSVMEFNKTATSRTLVSLQDYLTAIGKENQSPLNLGLLRKLHEEDNLTLAGELCQMAWIKQANRHIKQANRPPRKASKTVPVIDFTDEEKREAINTLKEIERREELRVEEMVKEFNTLHSSSI